MTWRARDPADIARYVIGCQLTQDAKVRNAWQRLGGQWAWQTFEQFIGCHVTRDPNEGTKRVSMTWRAKGQADIAHYVIGCQ
jgi:hypothetical protein